MDRPTPCNAIGSLGRMRARQAEPLLRELLSDDSLKVNAAIALSRITGRRHPLVPQGYRLDLPEPAGPPVTPGAATRPPAD